MAETDDTLPIFELINRLLIQQRIDFIASNIKESTERSVIGHLLFTSFFASSNKNQQSFSTYELIPIPFNQGNQRLKLAQMPHTVSISGKTLELIQWTKEESSSCQFKLLSSCRETPAVHKNWQKTCLFEIVTDSNLTLCRIELEPEPIFIQRIGPQWAISTINETRCHRVPQLEHEQHAITTNNEITIPPISLITIDKSTTWSCDHFLLPGIANGTDKRITIIDDRKLNYDDSNLINLHQTMNNNTQWEKIPYIPGNIKNMIEYIITTTPTSIQSTTSFYQHGLSIAIGILGVTTITSIVLYLRLRNKVSKTSTTEMITMPPI
ncbi:unnamed protein product [Rotaria sp. Silwood2]|nr:unnamed protein product [Rotaria sp. Silwood2]CAF2966178.1 unnamed protein product [Rotaria sp. Silwood2]CAF3968102.1 unnamed protein product [Rotaria sp. Silwood2]CAF4231057.1 unnamed protein product [Rotaria sp. Silwood2]CAF4315608.1 unnamed protein product [Rotaria sp. Silwood2]